MPSALSLWVNDLVLKLFGLCYDSGIVSLSLCLNPVWTWHSLSFLLPATLKNVAKSASLCYIDAGGSGS